jgi:hypothetical protein
MMFNWREEIAVLKRKDTDALAAAKSVAKFLPVMPILVLVDAPTWEMMKNTDEVECLEDHVGTLTLDDVRKKSVIFSVFDEEHEAEELVGYWLAMLNDSVALLEIEE